MVLLRRKIKLPEAFGTCNFLIARHRYDFFDTFARQYIFWDPWIETQKPNKVSSRPLSRRSIWQYLDVQARGELISPSNWKKILSAIKSLKLNLLTGLTLYLECLRPLPPVWSSWVQLPVCSEYKSLCKPLHRSLHQSSQCAYNFPTERLVSGYDPFLMWDLEFLSKKKNIFLNLLLDCISKWANREEK